MTKTLEHLHNIKKVINELDLEPIIERLVKIEGWSRKHALAASHQYKNFLYIKMKHLDEFNPFEFPPSMDIDEVWHAHILHTEDYMRFCHESLGRYLHHYPHHGNRAVQISDQQLNDMFERQTQKHYFEEFGEHIYEVRPTGLRGVLLQFFSWCGTIMFIPFRKLALGKI